MILSNGRGEVDVGWCSMLYVTLENVTAETHLHDFLSILACHEMNLFIFVYVCQTFIKTCARLKQKRASLLHHIETEQAAKC